jgi:hypothetical protein
MPTAFSIKRVLKHFNFINENAPLNSNLQPPINEKAVNCHLSSVNSIYPTSDSIGGFGKSCCEPGFSSFSCGALRGGFSCWYLAPFVFFQIMKAAAAPATRLLRVTQRAFSSFLLQLFFMMRIKLSLITMQQ